MRILQVTAAESISGADAVALALYRSFRDRGHDSWMAVGQKQSDDPHVFRIPNDEHRSLWPRACIGLGHRVPRVAKDPARIRSWQRFLRFALGAPGRARLRSLGLDDFEYPATLDIPKLPPEPPDLLHAHILHGPWLPEGGFFDLRALAPLSRAFPTVVTLHDNWLLTGHCLYPLECGRWKTGCGSCPHLDVPLGLPRDVSAENWTRKRDILAGCRLHVCAPSRWQLDRVRDSILAAGTVETRVLPHGIDRSVFHPGDRLEARAQLGIPPDARVLLFGATTIRRNPFKDLATLTAAIEKLDRPVLLLALGEAGPSGRIGSSELRFVPFVPDRRRVAQYFHASDLYVHAAKAEVWGLTITEALCCGIPVVATSVGGIPEQILPDRTGILTPPGDAGAMAAAIARLLSDDELRGRMGEAAARDAAERFDLDRQVRGYLDWYKEIIARRAGGSAP